MATEIGTASGPDDLFDKLIAFLTTDADLVSAGQAWEVEWTVPGGGRELVVRGPGLSGEDQIYVGLRLTKRDALDSYAIEASGMTGVLPDATTFLTHINNSPSYVRMFTDVGTVSYWFVANGRRFMIVLKISTIFESMYCGLFLPYATPVSYPYPLFIGGSAGDFRANYPLSQVPTNWRSESENHRHFLWGHGNRIVGDSYPVNPTAWMLTPGGDWRACVNNGSWQDPARIAPEWSGDHYFANRTSEPYVVTYNLMARLMDSYGGDRLMWPSILVAESPTDITYGILDGAYRCQGIANSAENLLTVNGKEHLVVQNVFRTDFNNYWAMVME